MRLLLFAVCASALAGAAVAQPYDDSYPNQGYQGQPSYGDNDSYGGYQDRGYQGDEGTQGYDRPHDYQSYDNSDGRRSYYYTGRTGASWRDDQGRYCSYREIAWRDAYGTAYQWVPRCHY